MIYGEGDDDDDHEHALAPWRGTERRENEFESLIRRPLLSALASNSCSVRVFINTGSRADLSSRARSFHSPDHSRNGDEGHVLRRATKEKVSRFPLLSIVSALRPSLILPLLAPLFFFFLFFCVSFCCLLAYLFSFFKIFFISLWKGGRNGID